VSEDDVLFGYRLQLVALAGRVGVSAACRTFGIHRSTYYAWKRKIEREGLGALRPRERRRPRVCSSYAWADLVCCPHGQPNAAQTSKLARRVAAELQAAGWRLERALTDNGSEFRGRFEQTLERAGARATRIRAGRPQTNGAVEALHKTILEECWRPAFARYLQVRFQGLRRDLDDYLRYYNHERAHTGRLTRGRIPADIVYGAHKMEAR
jgi:transposase InsO family protein